MRCETRLDLTEEHLAILLEILGRVVPEREVCAYGSRATGRARRMSDLDLVVKGEEPLTLGRMADLEDELRESDLPFRVDVLDWASTGTDFRLLIEKDMVVVRVPTGVV